MFAVSSTNLAAQGPMVRRGTMAVATAPARPSARKPHTPVCDAVAHPTPVLNGFSLKGAGFVDQPAAAAPLAAVPAAPVSQQPAAAAQFPAILSAAARTAEQVALEVEAQLQLCPQALVQGVEPEMYASMRKLLSGVQYHARAKMAIIKPKQEDRPGPLPPKQRRLPGMLCVVSAGPEDQAAADQVKLLAEHLGCFVITKNQLSIRDLQGLMDKLPALQAADAVVAIAGADGSLPGAIAGLVDVPVIALPTSQGNGSAGLGGLSGLLTAVSSCNLGVSCVGVDQPAAAAAMAARMLRMAAARVEKLTPPASAAAAAAPAASSNGVAAANNVVPTMLDSLSLTPAMATQ